jgi:acyl-lipid omega-6 desaturase (Delta-12 desaturase)
MIDARSLRRSLGRYSVPRNARGVVELGITLLPLAGLWIAAWLAFRLGHTWATLALAVPAAGLLVRLFMIQHDCGHGSFFSGRHANDWIGRILGVLTLTPYDSWRREHAMHHAGSGNLDRRGIGDIDTLTVDEYLARSRFGRLKYRLYRHPAVMFGIGPAYLFLLRHRVPGGSLSADWRPWVSAMANNGAIGLMVAALAWAIGLKAFLLVHLPIVWIAGSLGVWLFYVQHQFEHTSWDDGATWTPHAAALHGSSHYDLPAVLRWFTANIGVHHVHHLNSRIPYYRLPRVLQDCPELRSVGRLTLAESFRCVRLVLWDGAQRRLVSFREANRADHTGQAPAVMRNA